MNYCSTELCSDCPNRVVCRCLKVTEGEIVEAIVNHDLETIRELKRMTGAGDGCTCCHEELETYFERISLAVA